jgi:hypothetical protein
MFYKLWICFLKHSHEIARLLQFEPHPQYRSNDDGKLWIQIVAKNLC